MLSITLYLIICLYYLIILDSISFPIISRVVVPIWDPSLAARSCLNLLYWILLKCNSILTVQMKCFLSLLVQGKDIDLACGICVQGVLQPLVPIVLDLTIYLLNLVENQASVFIVNHMLILMNYWWSLDYLRDIQTYSLVAFGRCDVLLIMLNLPIIWHSSFKLKIILKSN